MVTDAGRYISLMCIAKRKDQSGGSAMGGRADDQAEAYALISAKILSEEALNRVNTNSDRVPAFVGMETGASGDNLQLKFSQYFCLASEAKCDVSKCTKELE